MADTERSLSALLSLLADNAGGDISAQDMRDVVVSLLPDNGAIFISTSAATTMTLVDTYYEVAGTTTLSSVVRDFDMPANGRLRYTAAPTRRTTVAGTISMTSDTNNQVIGFKLAKNGVVNDNTIVTRKVGTGSDVGNVMLAGAFSLAQNDYVSCFIENQTSAGTTVTLEHMVLSAVGYIE